MTLTIDEREIIFNVLYSKRKSLALEINPEGHITIKAPSKTPEAAINAFVMDNKKEIFSYQDKLANRKYITSQKSYHSEETFLYMGKACSLGELLEPIPETEAEVQAALKKFYTAATKKYVKKRVAHFEKVIGVKSKGITIVDSPMSWGTCNSLKALTFNYKLSMAPPIVIDYVVIHELCHILHMNHDRSFWRKVGMYDPNFKKHQGYLGHFGGVMTI